MWRVLVKIEGLIAAGITVAPGSGKQQHVAVRVRLDHLARANDTGADLV
jgi:hypothetical protein